MSDYDYLIVGAGLWGLTFAREMTDKGKKCLIIDKRDHVGGNIYDSREEGILMHQYGPHIFHCNNDDIWKFVNRFSSFDRFTLRVKARAEDNRIYSLPFTMNTINQIYGITEIGEARKALDVWKTYHMWDESLEGHAIRSVGKEIYELLIRGYTEKQWGKKCSELPSEIIKRLPIRFNWDDDYFNDKYQGMPSEGYTKMAENMLSDIPYILNLDYKHLPNDIKYNKLVYTGCIDEYFDYRYGKLEYRSLRFAHELLDQEYIMGIPIMNYTSSKTPWTRIIEHKFFYPRSSRIRHTIITREYPSPPSIKDEPFYPVRTSENLEKLKLYKEEARKIEDTIIFGGRLAEFMYYDMHMVIGSALEKARKELKI